MKNMKNRAALGVWVFPLLFPVILSSPVERMRSKVLWKDGVRSCVLGPDLSNFDAEAVFIDYPRAEVGQVRGTDGSGWARLWVRAVAGSADAGDLAYAAGCAEGMVTAEKISAARHDLFAGWGFLDGPIPEKLRSFLEDNIAFTRGEAENGSGPYWDAVLSVVSQVEGLVEGYGASGSVARTTPIGLLDMWMLNAAGSMEDLRGLLRDPLVDAAPPAREVPETDCSGLIRLVDGDVFVGHTTWRSYTAMVRMLKRYDLPSFRSVAFSSTPAFVSSKDDFYVTSANLGVFETTNNVFNTTLFDEFLTPKSLLTFVRSTVANRIAATPTEWAETFALHNSGTYNNQWDIIDMPTAAKERPLPAGTFVIAEQIPGRVKIGDVSSVLQERGFWPSYNIPYFKEIYDASGYPAKAAGGNDAYSYTNCPRAKIFARDAPSVTSPEKMRRIMQYCDFESDPLSLGKPYNCISSRYDLIDPATGEKPAAFGGIDSKILAVQLGAENLVFQAITGPTHDQQPVFSWLNNTWASLPHVGQPDIFDFPWMIFDVPPQ